MTGMMRPLGIAAIALAAANGLFFVLQPAVRWPMPEAFLLAALALALAYALASLALGERARLARDPWWPAIPLLAALGLAPYLLDLLDLRAEGSGAAAARVLFLAAPLALLLAAFRAARARGARAPAAAGAFTALYALAGLAQGWALVSLMPREGPGMVYAYNASAALVPLLLLGALLASAPLRGEGSAWRLAGAVAAGVGAGVAAGSMLVLVRLADAQPLQPTNGMAFAAYGAGTAALHAGIAAVALGVALARHAPPPASPGARPEPADAA